MKEIQIKTLKYIIPILAVLLIFACKKLENDALNVDESNSPKAALNIKVINTDDQLPLAGVKVIISRKVSAKGQYQQVDTIRTNKDGLITTELPYPNYIKLQVDTAYYHKVEKELDFNSSNGASAELYTSPKFGMTPLNIAVTDQNDVAIPGFLLDIATKAPGTTGYISTGGMEQVDADGKLVVSLPYPNLVKVAVADTLKYFPDTLMAELKNAKSVSLALKAKLKPTSVPLEVTVLNRNSGTPMAGVDVVVLQKLTGEAEFKNINLSATTNADGKIEFAAPFEGEVKIRTADDVYFAPDSVVTRLAYEKNRKVTLKSLRLTPKSPVEVSIYDASNSQILPGVTVKVSSKLKNENIFTVDTIAVSDEEGKLKVDVRFSGEMKFEVIDDTYFANKTITASNVGATAKQVSMPLMLKNASYPEPVLTDLRVTTLKLNNALTLSSPTDVAIDKRGNTYICDQNNHRVIRVSRNGNTTVLAGNGTAGAVDGAGAMASFNKPWGLALNDAGTELFVSDNSGHKIRKITIDLTNMTGTVSTIAGSGSSGTYDAVGASATFNRPGGLALDETANVLYVTDYANNRVRKITLSDNTVYTVSTSAIYAPIAVALSPDKTDVYVATFGNSYGSTGSQLIRLATANGARTGLCGTVKDNYNNPSGLYISQGGKIFIANEQAHMISQLKNEVLGGQNGDSTFSYIAGSPTFSTTTTNGVTGTPGNVDGAATDARFNRPWAINYNTYGGNFLIVDQGNNQVRIMKSSTIN